MIFRGQDALAVQAIVEYLRIVEDRGCVPEHCQAVQARIDAFLAFAEANPDRVKLPDTPVPDQGVDNTPPDV